MSFLSGDILSQQRNRSRSRSEERYDYERDARKTPTFAESLDAFAKRLAASKKEVMFHPGVQAKGFNNPTQCNQVMYNLITDNLPDEVTLNMDDALKYKQLGISRKDPDVMKRYAALLGPSSVKDPILLMKIRQPKNPNNLTKSMSFGLADLYCPNTRGLPGGIQLEGFRTTTKHMQQTIHLLQPLNKKQGNLTEKLVLMLERCFAQSIIANDRLLCLARLLLPFSKFVHQDHVDSFEGLTFEMCAAGRLGYDAYIDYKAILQAAECSAAEQSTYLEKLSKQFATNHKKRPVYSSRRRTDPSREMEVDVGTWTSHQYSGILKFVSADIKRRSKSTYPPDTKTPNGGRDKGRPRKKDMVCWNCGKKGHNYRNCKQPRTEECKKKIAEVNKNRKKKQKKRGKN